MSRQPETIDRCELVVHTSLEQMGFAIAALTRLGIENIQHRLITDELRYKQRRAHEISADQFAVAFVKDKARFKIADLTAAFKQAGRTPSAAYVVAKKLLKTRVVAKDGDEYVRVEALPAPKGKTKTTRRGGQPKLYDVPNRTLIMRAIKGRKHITVRTLRDLFVKEGRPEKSISPVLTTMVAAKLIKQTGVGEYDVLAKAKPKPMKVRGRKAVKQPPLAPRPNLNGAGVANG